MPSPSTNNGPQNSYTATPNQPSATPATSNSHPFSLLSSPGRIDPLESALIDRAENLGGRLGQKLGANVRDNHDVDLGIVANTIVDIGAGIAGRAAGSAVMRALATDIALKN